MEVDNSARAWFFYGCSKRFRFASISYSLMNLLRADIIADPMISDMYVRLVLVLLSQIEISGGLPYGRSSY